MAWASWPPHLTCAALHARYAGGPILAVNAWRTRCSLWACYPLGSSGTLAPHIPLLTSSARWPPWAFFTRWSSSSDGAYHAFISTRTRLSLRSCHSWVAPDALGTRWSRDALLSRGTHISLRARLPLATRIAQNPPLAWMPLDSLQSLGAFRTSWTVGWTQEIRTPFQALDGSWLARFPRGSWGP